MDKDKDSKGKNDKNHLATDLETRGFNQIERGIFFSIFLLAPILLLTTSLCLPISEKGVEYIQENNRNLSGLSLITSRSAITLKDSDLKVKKEVEVDSCGVQFYTKGEKSFVYFFNHTYGWVDSAPIFTYEYGLGVLFIILSVIVVVGSTIFFFLGQLMSFYYAKMTGKFYAREIIKYDDKFHTREIEVLISLLDSSMQKTSEIEHYSTESLKNLVLENDVILGKSLSELGVEGDILGELLRNVKFFSQDILRRARSAHGIRNMAAHSISDSGAVPRERLIQAVYDFKKVFMVLKVELQNKKNSIVGK